MKRAALSGSRTKHTARPARREGIRRMKILLSKWYWARRLIGNRVEVYSGPFDTRKKAWNSGIPYSVYGIETLRGRVIADYDTQSVIDKTEPP